MVVDKNRAPGQYVVTGSSDIYSAPESKEGLAGIEVKAGAGVGKDDFKHIKWR